MAIVISGVNNNDKITASDGTIDLLSGVNYAGIITAPAFTATGNLTAASINVDNNIQLGTAGIVTAITFVGNVTGNVNATSNLLLQIGGSEKVRITSDGKVGIGTDTPNGDLQIRAGQNASFRVLADPSTSGLFVGNYGSGDGYRSLSLLGSVIRLHTVTAGSLSGATEKVTIASDGKVGIGTNNPTEQLEIYNGASFGDSTFRMRSLDSATKITLDARGTNASSMIYFTSGSQVYDAFLQLKHNFSGDHYLRYCHNGSADETFRIHSTGALGLGGANYGTAGQYLKSNGSGVVPSWGTARFSTYAFICELNGDTTDAGTLTANQWITRDVTHEQADPDNIVTLDGSGNFTLQAGTYFVEWSAPAFRCDRHTTRLYDVNAGIAKGFGTLEFSQDATSAASTASRGFARFTISSSNTYRLETKGQVTKSGDGLGLDPASFAICLYAFAKIYKESE